MRKILFLDFDGVLNSKEGWIRDEPETSTYVTPECVAQLKDLLKRCEDVEIVISSTWRLYFSIEAFKAMFDVLGLPGKRIIGRTPRGDGKHFSVERGYEIADWLDLHRDVKKFVILDDDADMGHLMDHLVQTDSTYGLTSKEVEEMVRRFK